MMTSLFDDGDYDAAGPVAVVHPVVFLVYRHLAEVVAWEHLAQVVADAVAVFWYFQLAPFDDFLETVMATYLVFDVSDFHVLVFIWLSSFCLSVRCIMKLITIFNPISYWYYYG